MALPYAAACVLGYYATGPQAPVTHAMQIFGQKRAGAPLFALHGVASMNPHSYDASFRIRLFADDEEVTDQVQAARAAAPAGMPFYLNPDSAPGVLLPQLAGSYFDLPRVRSLDGWTLYRGYNPSNAKGAKALAAAGKPVQQLANGSTVRFEPGDVLLTELTMKVEEAAVWHPYSINDASNSQLTYHLLGTNEAPLLQHRVSGGVSGWSQVLPIQFDEAFAAANDALPQPPATALEADGKTVAETSAVRTLNVAGGSCYLRVPGRSDHVDSRIGGGEVVQAEVECLYYCSLSEPVQCLNEFEPLAELPNNMILPTTTFRVTVSAGAVQGFYLDKVDLLPGAADLLALSRGTHRDPPAPPSLAALALAVFASLCTGGVATLLYLGVLRVGGGPGCGGGAGCGRLVRCVRLGAKLAPAGGGPGNVVNYAADLAEEQQIKGGVRAMTVESTMSTTSMLSKDAVRSDAEAGGTKVPSTLMARPAPPSLLRLLLILGAAAAVSAAAAWLLLLL